MEHHCHARALSMPDSVIRAGGLKHLRRISSSLRDLGRLSTLLGSQEMQSVSTSPESTNVTVLIVEDDAVIATVIEEALKQAGFKVLPPTHTAEQGLQLARQHRSTLALLDIELLGGTNGIELGSQLRQELNIPCIFVSGRSEPETVAASAEAQPISWLKKPFGPGSIVASVQLALRR